MVKWSWFFLALALVAGIAGLTGAAGGLSVFLEVLAVVCLSAAIVAFARRGQVPDAWRRG